MAKTTKIVARARIAHKLAKYVRAAPIHFSSKPAASKPSVSHLVHGGPESKKISNKQNTWYASDDEKTLHKRKRTQPKPSTGRKSIQAGSIVILLSGKHKGRRVVVLKHLSSGRLLITGPYAVNGVPIRRVSAAYTIATSIKVDLTGVAANIDDSFFKAVPKLSKFQLKHASEAQQKKVETEASKSAAWKVEAKKTQKSVDDALLANIKKTGDLSKYLATRFTLYSADKPHAMKF